MQILIVLTSHDRLGDTGKPTGFWLEELAAPYYVFKDAGAVMTFASPGGGTPPLDPRSSDPAAQTDATRRFEADSEAMGMLANTHRLVDVKAADYDAVFYPGGHGPLWDLADDGDSIALVETMIRAGKPVAAVCHAPAIFRRTRILNGLSLIQGKAVTGFSNSEERASGLTDVVPFLVEDMLKANGGNYRAAADWGVNVVTDGLIVTGQNPASSGPAATALLALLKKR
jgi:putative intracellular protease/amidase